MNRPTLFAGSWQNRVLHLPLDYLSVYSMHVLVSYVHDLHYCHGNI